MKKIIFTLITSIGLFFASCESEQVKMGRDACYDMMGKLSGKVEGDSHYTGKDGRLYWELEYHHWSEAKGTQVEFVHFVTNGNYAKDITKKEFESQTGRTAKISRVE